MKLSDTQTLALPPSADMHVHLRQDAMAELVAPQIRKGGVDTVFVMVRTLHQEPLMVRQPRLDLD